ncbi:MAG: sulfotransferase [Gaiellales bacterium]
MAYVGSTSRSGSTVLELLLANLPGFVAVGELRHLWQRGVVENQLCGCGEPFHECPFWHEVGERAFGGWDRADSSGAVELQGQVDRFRYLPLAVAPSLWPPYRRRLDDYAERTARVYRAVAEVSGAEVIVDSSKTPAFAAVVDRIPDIPVHLIHLVRDSRGVAYSWRRRVRRPETSDGSDMPTYGPSRIAVEWMVWNSVFEFLSPRRRRTRVRYETLVEDPQRDLARIAAEVGGPTDEAAYGFVSDGIADIGVHHTVSGNRVRFRRGALRLSVDTEWRARMAWRDRKLVSVLTWPLLLGYGYLTPPATRAVRRTTPQRDIAPYAARPVASPPSRVNRQPARSARRDERQAGPLARAGISSGDGPPHRR